MEIDDVYKQRVLVNSNQRLNGTASHFMFAMPFTSDKKYNRVCCLQADIPTSDYLVQSGYNDFSLQEDATITTISVTPSNYDVNSLMSVVGSLLTQASASNGFNSTFTLTYPNVLTSGDTGKITFTISGGTSTSRALIFSSVRGINIQLGFDVSSTNNFAAGTLTSTNVINLHRSQVLYILCDNVHDSNNKILQIVPNVSVPSMSVIAWQTTSVEGWAREISSPDITVYTFMLQDETGQAPDLNGQDWTMELLFYRKSTLPSLLKQFIEFSVVPDPNIVSMKDSIIDLTKLMAMFMLNVSEKSEDAERNSFINDLIRDINAQDAQDNEFKFKQTRKSDIQINTLCENTDSARIHLPPNSNIYRNYKLVTGNKKIKIPTEKLFVEDKKDEEEETKSKTKKKTRKKKR